VKRSRIARKTEIKRGGKPRARNAKRWAKNHQRAHGPVERREWIKAQPCWACGILGYSDGAHIKTGGTSRKADARFQIPLCRGLRLAHGGCHTLQHQEGWSMFPTLHTLELREAAAAEIESAWLAYSHRRLEA
jgi:hypothetical protein